MSVRPWAKPLVPLYHAGVAAEEALYRAGFFQKRKLQWPVISIGSLAAGGAGKTPLVVALANMLHGHGWHVDVLSRGYGRQGKITERVDFTEMGLAQASRRFGDEPVMIAEQTNLPVWVSSDRFEAGQAAEAEEETHHQSRKPRRVWRDRVQQISSSRKTEFHNEEEPQICLHLLDDGFQHRRLERALDIVLVTAEDLGDSLIPAGNLREPLTALQRAGTIVIREEEREDIEEHVRVLTKNVPLWSIRRTLRFPQPLGVFSAGLKPIAFCGIARPENFASMLAEAGCGIVETVAFRDHNAYDTADIDRIVEVARGLNATGFLTTEKDAVKLTPALHERLSTVGPLAVVGLRAEFIYKAPVMRTLEKLLQSHQAGPKPTANSDTAPQAREAHSR